MKDNKMIKIGINDKDKLEKFFSNDSNNINYYYSFPSFYSHFCVGIYSAYFYDENNIVIKKYNKNPRINIISNDKEIPLLLINELKNLNPLFIKRAFKLSETKKKESEYIFNNKEIIEELNTPKFKKVRNSINFVKKKYNVIVEELKPKHKDLLIKFIMEWKEQHKHYFRLTYKRDIYLLDMINDLFGVVIINEEGSIIGAELNHKHINQKNLCINIFRKHNIKYKNLHEFVRYESAKISLQKGYEYSNDTVATDANLRKFKDKFLGEKGYMFDLYEQEIYKKEKMKSKNLMEFAE